MDDTAGLDAGAAYLFDATTGNLLQTFLNPTPEQNDLFGSSLAIRGNKVLVGASQDDTLGLDNGAVYLFDATTGQLLDTFLRPTPVDIPERRYAAFGVDVGFLDDDHVIIADRYDNTGAERAGAVYVYEMTVVPEPGTGDVNGDGIVDAADIDGVAAAVRNTVTDSKFDVNEDRQVTFADHTHLVKTILNTWIGDANLDKEFNTRDFVQVFQIGEYEDAIAGNSGWSAGDWNGDGDFSSGDFIAAFRDGGFERGPRPAESSVPEPSATTLALVALLGLVRHRRTDLRGHRHVPGQLVAITFRLRSGPDHPPVGRPGAE